ncbi:hypothetical protein [Spiroplasma endosymbiont of Aspidapion aeneum]|uniref:hypothetical protein n=1 Tax=Spiroplasma endosymbiont of Aspidapion aeneum TaxID=3066276 RepID=UPI00313E503C
MNKLLRSYITEFTSRNISSFRRIIKLLSIVCVPFLYAFLCVFSFWDPIGNIGNGSMVVVNNDKRVLVYQNGMPTDRKYNIGIVVDNNDNPVDINSYKENLSFEDQYMGKNYYLENSFSKDGKNKQPLNKLESNNFNSWQWMSSWDVLKSIFNKSDNQKSDQESNWTLSFKQGTQDYNFKHIKYIDATKNKNYKTNKYNSVMTIQSGTIIQLLSIVEQINAYQHNIIPPLVYPIITLSDIADSITKLNKIEFEAKYSNGFIYGYYLNSTLRFSTAISQSLLPAFISENMSNLFYNQLSYTPSEDQTITSYSSASTKLKKNISYIISDIKNGSNNPITKDDTAYGDVALMDYKSTPPTPDSNPGGKIVKNVKYLFGHDVSNYYKSLKDLNIFSLDNTFSFNKLPLFFSDINNPDLVSDLSIIIDGIMYDVSHGINFATDNTRGFYSSTLNVPIHFSDIQTSFHLFYKFGNQIEKYFQKAALYGNIYNNETPQAAVPKLQFKNEFKQLLTKAEFPNIATFIVDISNNLINKIDNLIPITIGGSSYAYYGLGIGLLFLVIGIYLGTFIQTFIYDRGKREKNTNAYQWYFSKTMVMATTSILQASLGLLGAIIAGWWILPISILFSLWGVLILASIAFAMIIQLVWFFTKDEAIGRFIIVIILISNLASCGGVFPGFMQFKFFDLIGNLSIFHYVIDLERLLIFNISENGFTNKISNLFFLDLSVIVLMIVLTAIAGILVSRKINRVIVFGTSKPKIIQAAIEEYNLPYNFVISKNEVIKNRLEDKINKINVKQELIKTTIKKLVLNDEKTKIELEKLNTKTELNNTKILNLKTAIDKILISDNDKVTYNFRGLPIIRDEKIYWYSIKKTQEKQFAWYKNQFNEPTMKINYTEYDDNEDEGNG